MDKSKPVLVTGATGYVAGRLIEKLLQEGISVHASVRDPTNHEKLKNLRELASENNGTIKFFKSDLLVADSFMEAMENCEVVFHTASPFTLAVKDAQKELIDPALLGTENILDSIDKTLSVKRLVLTSSVMAMYGDAIDAQSEVNKTITESSWNSTSSLSNGPYSYSKLLAEKKAWEYYKQQSRWDLVVINPAFVMGPGISNTYTSESYKFMKQLIDGSSKSGVPYLSFGVVDVRDLAVAHYNAAFLPEAEGRNILCAGSVTMLEMGTMIRKAFGKKYKVAKKELPKFLVYIFGPFIGLNKAWIKNNVGWPLIFDNSKSKNQLGVNYRPLEETIVEFAEQVGSN